jgi:hypothetical protein
LQRSTKSRFLVFSKYSEVETPDQGRVDTLNTNPSDFEGREPDKESGHRGSTSDFNPNSQLVSLLITLCWGLYGDAHFLLQ